MSSAKDKADLIDFLKTTEGQEYFNNEVQKEIDAEVLKEIANGDKPDEINTEMEIGDYAVLYEVNPGKGIFVPIIYQITAFNMIENTKHIYTVKLCPIRTVGPGSFDDHIVTMTLDRIAFYHNKEIICEELLEDHRRWLTGKRADERVHRLVELNLLAKCKYPKNNF